MKKLSLALALVAGFMLPLTAVAHDSSSSKSKSKRKKASSKNEKAAAQSQPEKKTETTVVGGKLSDEQLMLNSQAVAAVRNNEFKKAEQLYQALLQLGEFNYIWYQLGRTYARQDKCIEAYDAYEHVANAPILDPEEYNPEMIRDATQKGVKELDEQCSAKVVFTCNPEEMTLSVDGGVEFACSSKPVPLVPGRHSVYAKTSFGFNTVVVEAITGQVTPSKIDVVNYEEVAINAGVTPEELERRSKLFKILGYTFIGAGTVIGVGGGVWMKMEKKTNDERMNHPTKYFCKDGKEPCEASGYDSEKANDYYKGAKTRLAVSYATLATGAVMAVTGVVLVIYDVVKIQPQLEELNRGRSFNLSPVVSPEFSGFALTGTF